ncbi:MAG: YkgJ family cysteine cluster protein [Methylococcaceae bacterium]
MNTLTQLHTDIDTRVQTIIDDNTDWLCHKGCDTCCKRLAEIPKLTAKEWALLQEGLSALPKQQLLDISQAMTELAQQSTRPLTCPMLDQSLGACRVYAHRPVACRSYGFYVQRDKGLYCQEIEARVAEGEWATVVWGNHDVIDRQLNALGDSRDLTEWFALWHELF